MPVLRLDVVIRVIEDVVLAHERREPGAVGIHAAADPDRLRLVDGKDDELVDVEGPTVISAQVVHVGRIGRQEHFDALLFHPLLRLLDAFQVFGCIEPQLHRLTPSQRVTGSVRS